MKLPCAKVSVLRSLKVKESAIFEFNPTAVSSVIATVRANVPQRRGRGNKKGPIIRCDWQFHQQKIHVLDFKNGTIIEASQVMRTV